MTLLSDRSFSQSNKLSLPPEGKGEVERGKEQEILWSVPPLPAVSPPPPPPENGGLFVNTKGTCFLCLKQAPSLSSGFYSGRDLEGTWKEGSEQAGEGQRFCRWNIFRYLNITLGSIAKSLEEESGGPPPVEGKEGDFSVLICAECAVVTGNLGRWCEELEVIQRRVEQCVERVQEIISKSEKNQVLVKQLKKRLAASSRKTGKGGGAKEEKKEEGVLNLKLVDLLRKETKEKCLNKLGHRELLSPRLTPEVKHATVNTDSMSSSSSSSSEMDTLLPLPQTMREDCKVIILKGDANLLPHNPYPIQDLQTEWPNSQDTSVPPAQQKIRIGSLPHNDLLFPSSPGDTPSDLLTPSPSSSVVSATCLLPPPPPVNIPRRPKRPAPKNRRIPPKEKEILESVDTSSPKCPVDFYFHEKQGNRHVCPFCPTHTSPTLTNLRFHVIRAHTEKLFSTFKMSHISEVDFKATCERVLSKVTKEAETGERHSSGNKALVKCQFCEDDPDAKLYHDKRAFQCHLILNHYPALHHRLMEMQMETEASPIKSTNSAVTLTFSRSSEDTQGHLAKIPKMLTPQDLQLIQNVTTNENGGLKLGYGGGKNAFVCEHCGKGFTSSASRWRHKQRYCDVLRGKQNPPEHRLSLGPSTADFEMSSSSSVYFVTPEGNLIDEGEGEEGEEKMEVLNGVTSKHVCLSSGAYGNGEDKTGLELLLQEANDMILKQDGGGRELGGEETEEPEEYDQFVTEFQDYYDEDEVNDALLTMMMENVPGVEGHSLQI